IAVSVATLNGAIAWLIRRKWGKDHTWLHSQKCFCANVDADRRRFGRSARHESGKRLLRFQLGYRFELKRPPTEAALLFLSGPLFHDLDVSVNLIGNHDPAAREICQDRGFGFV